MADALASGASARKGVGVQVPPRARTKSPVKTGDFSLHDTVCIASVVSGCSLGEWFKPARVGNSHLRSHLHDQVHTA